MNVGERYGLLVVIAVWKFAKAKSLVTVVCDCGKTKDIKNYYSLKSGDTKSCGCLRIAAAKRMGLANKKDHVDSDYLRALAKVRSAKGKATEYECADCERPARQWSYEGGDPDERLEPRQDNRHGGEMRWVKFSMTPEMYSARCLSCHIRHSIDVKRGRKKTSSPAPSSV